MKRETALNLIAYAFILLFVYTALSKWFTYDIYLYDLQRSPELGFAAGAISILIPGAELTAAALLLFSRTRRSGFWLSLLLMTAFTLYVAYVILFASKWPCTCGGIIRDLSWPQHLAFNIVFTLLAVLGLRLSRRGDGGRMERRFIPT
ncbi:MauE/DoxX family redox-associated membrane protein [Chitinophaga lutea]